jgi:hypothetical protein
MRRAARRALHLCHAGRVEVDVSAPDFFAAALTAPILYTESGSSAAIFSPDERFRYVLTREWDACRGKLAIIGLNPSTATAEQDDPTIRRCIGFAKREGFGGLAMLNLFAYRATDPRELTRALTRGENIVGELNDSVLRLYGNEGRIVLAAWGAGGALCGRGRDVTRNLVAAGADVRCLGLTTQGDPRHPLYMRADAPFQAFAA